MCATLRTKSHHQLCAHSYFLYDASKLLNRLKDIYKNPARSQINTDATS